MIEKHLANITLRMEYDADWGGQRPHRVTVLQDGETICVKEYADPMEASRFFAALSRAAEKVMTTPKRGWRYYLPRFLFAALAGFLLGRVLLDLIFG